jgi:hypothetical protein
MVQLLIVIADCGLRIADCGLRIAESCFSGSVAKLLKLGTQSVHIAFRVRAYGAQIVRKK